MSSREALLGTLGEKRESLQREAARHRDARDALNERTRQNARRRDDLNAQVRAVVERANAHRAKRDELNAKVREAKAERDRLNREAHEKSARLQELRKARGGTGPAGGPPLSKLKAELRHLEYQQQTTVMTPKKEKDLIDLIAAKQKEIKAREAESQDDPELRAAQEELRAAKAKAEERHAELGRHAAEAQEEHDRMAALFAEADGLRKQADAAQVEFVKSKVESDRLHRLYVDRIMAIKDLDRVAAALRGPGEERGGGSSRQGSGAASDQADADRIFDRFRKGEKLSTEDLMALQKAGRL